MVDYLAQPVIHEAFFKKYASKKFLKGMLKQRTLFFPPAYGISSLHSYKTMGEEVPPTLP